MSKETVLVFIPAPGMGHIVSAIEMAKLIIHQDSHLSITVLIIKRPNYPELDSYIKSLEANPNPRMNFVEISDEKTSSQLAFSKNFLSQLIAIHKNLIRDYISETISSGSVKVAGIVIDTFCSPMIDIANEFNLPSYLYFTSGAAALGLVFHMQALQHYDNQDLSEYKDQPEKELIVSTFINPVPAKVLPRLALDKQGGSVFLNHTKRFRETKGILVNSFLELESHAVKSLSKMENTDISHPLPPVYAVGPILNLDNGNDHNEKSEMIMKWLDNQPDSSVVFLCFGSMGTFEDDQVKEIAYALEKSEKRFLWSLRRPPPKDKVEMPSDYEDPEEVLPEGFLKRTEDIGKVIGWAPQVAVLSHPAVGGFVSHCGWNSTLESIWCGVPMATWPLFAEQQANAFILVKELGLGVEIKMDYYKESPVLVTAEEIENGIRQLMDPESEIRAKVKEMKEKSELALKEGGSSQAFLRKFIKDVMHNIS